MQDPVPTNPKDDFMSSLSLWAFALAFATIAIGCRNAAAYTLVIA